MNKLLSLLMLTLLFITLFVACDEEEFTITDPVDQEFEVLDLNVTPIILDDVESSATVDQEFLEEENKESEINLEKNGQWTTIWTKRYRMRSSGLYHIYTVPKQTLEAYDYRIVTYNSTDRIRTYTYGHSPYRRIRHRTNSPGNRTTVSASFDDLRSGESSARFLIRTWEANTISSFRIERRVKTSPIPSGYSIHESGDGVTMFKKNNANVYIQRVDISKARLDFKTCPLDNPPCYDCNSQYEVPNYLLNYNAGWFHNNYRNQSKYFSMVNGAFFATGGSRWGSISFPIKDGGNFISHGHDNSSNKRPYTRAFAINSSRAYAFDYVHGDDIRHSTVENDFDNYNMAIVGFKPSISAPGTRPNDNTGRTMIAIDRNNRNIVYIYSASNQRTTVARQELISAFNVRESEIIMLDGGGSSSLYSKQNNSLIYASRKIPNMILVYED